MARKRTKARSKDQGDLGAWLRPLVVVAMLQHFLEVQGWGDFEHMQITRGVGAVEVRYKDQQGNERADGCRMKSLALTLWPWAHAIGFGVCERARVLCWTEAITRELPGARERGAL